MIILTFDHTVISFLSFFFTATPTTEISTLSLHDALPILAEKMAGRIAGERGPALLDCSINYLKILFDDCDRRRVELGLSLAEDRKSTRLNSSHQIISYAVFCLKKKKKNNKN